MKKLALPILLLLSLPTFGQRGQKIAYHSLEASYVTINALDMVTTYHAFKYGAVEANPVMEPFIHNKAQGIAFKGIATFGTLAILRLVRKDHPKGALVTLAVLNVGMGALVYHNYQLTVKLKF